MLVAVVSTFVSSWSSNGRGVVGRLDRQAVAPLVEVLQELAEVRRRLVARCAAERAVAGQGVQPLPVPRQAFDWKQLHSGSAASLRALQMSAG